MSIFNEETLENAVIELFAAEGYPHVHGAVRTKVLPQSVEALRADGGNPL